MNHIIQKICIDILINQSTFVNLPDRVKKPGTTMQNEAMMVYYYIDSVCNNEGFSDGKVT